ncbi:MAG: iron-sulfur cluster assembly protein [Nocardiopsaceae bacterium]|jgi:metal-sulfur cluster biosynthetic enzyme|nr:iron-sulfur cluster assembly protein [Nocardiopsaceae bacterium]
MNSGTAVSRGEVRGRTSRRGRLNAAATARTPTLADRVLAALGAVRDPELDEPVTSLGFVSSCSVSPAGEVRVLLRLPTYFCAPNFAFLMVADAYDAVSTVPGVVSTAIVLEDHFASDAINGGVAARAGFVASFDGEAVAELDQLRADFLRKAVMAGTDLVCRSLAGAGRAGDDLARMTLRDAPPSAELDRLRRRRAELGLPAGDDAALVIDPVTGDRVSTGQLPLHLRRARTFRVSMEANTGICRGMLRHRYQATGLGEEEAR